MKNLVQAGISLSRKAKVQNDRDHADAREIQSNLAQHENRPEGRPTNPGIPVATLGSGRKSRKGRAR